MTFQKDDAQLVGFGMAANFLTLHTLSGLARLGVITGHDVLDIIDRARENFASKAHLTSDPAVAEAARSYLDMAKLMFGAEEQKQTGNVQ